MYHPSRRIRLASEIRRITEALGDTQSELISIGLDKLSFQISDARVELLQVHSKLLEPFIDAPASRPRGPACGYPAEELPF